MSPIVKKALAAIAAKELLERINEARKPKKPSLIARFGRLLLIGGGIGAGYYVYKSGKLQPLIDKVRGTQSGSSDSTSRAGGNGAGEGGDIHFRSETQPVGAPVG